MTAARGEEPAKEPLKRAKKAATPSSVTYDKPIRTGGATASTRLEDMTKGRIEALENDKWQLQVEVKRLQGRIDEIGPANHRLAESLANAESNNLLATILIGVGGFAVSYATFMGEVAAKVADWSAGCLIAGITVMIFQSIRRWWRK